MKIIIKKKGEDDQFVDKQLKGRDLFEYLHCELGSPAEHVIRNMIEHKQDMSWLNDQCWVYDLKETLEHWRQGVENCEHALEERGADLYQIRTKMFSILRDMEGGEDE